MRHPPRRFRNPPAPQHDTVAATIGRALIDRQEEAAIGALVGIALADTDRPFIERCCLKVGDDRARGTLD